MSSALNGNKSDNTPDQWVPPNVGYACTFAESYVEVKFYWDLSVAPADATALDGMLAGCP